MIIFIIIIIIIIVIINIFIAIIIVIVVIIRALGAVISKFKSFRNAGYNDFSKMYESHVVPVIVQGYGVIKNLKKGSKFKIEQLDTIWVYI